MITQQYQQGEHSIKIEIAESLEDAELNNFKKGEYTRYYINNKLTDNYYAMIRFIIEEAKKNKQRFIPSGTEIMKKREELFQKQNETISEYLKKLKEQYKNMSIPENILENVNEIIDKMDPITNTRITK